MTFITTTKKLGPMTTQGKARFLHKPGPTQTFTCSEKYSYALSSDRNFSTLFQIVIEIKPRVSDFDLVKLGDSSNTTCSNGGEESTAISFSSLTGRKRNKQQFVLFFPTTRQINKEGNDSVHLGGSHFLKLTILSLELSRSIKVYTVISIG